MKTHSSVRRAFRLALGVLGMACAVGASGAATWTAINTGLPASPVNVSSIVIAPKAPSIIYARTYSADGSGGLFKSTDGAASWKAMSSIVQVNAVIADPQNASVVYALTGRGVQKSINGGDTWTSANAGLPDFIPTLVIDPVNTSNLYAAASPYVPMGGGIYKSTDGGASWNALTGLPSKASISTLAVDPAAPLTIYAIGSLPPDPSGPPGPSIPALFKSVDGGASWNTLSSGLPAGAGLGSLTIGTSSAIYAIGSLRAPGPPGQTLFKSTDGGVSFSMLDTGLPSGASIASLALDPKDASVIYLAVVFGFAEAGGILKSTDGGKSWRSLSPGLPANTPIQSFVVDPAGSSTLYLIANQNIYKSTDGGTRWSKSVNGLAAVNVGVVAVNYSDAGTVYAGTGENLFKSVDDGATWSKLFAFQIHSSPSAFGFLPFPLLDAGYVRSLLIDSTNPDNLFAATYRPNGCFFADNLLFRSTDGGASWSDSVSPDKSGCVLGGGFGPSAGLKAMDPSDPNTLYVSETDDEDGGWWLLQSRDGGATWKSIGGDFPGHLQAGVWSLAIDPSDSTTLYAGIDDVPIYSDDGTTQPGAGGVFKSTDGGATWKMTGLSGGAVNLIVIDPAQSNLLYAVTSGDYAAPRGFRGLSKSTDSGATWSPADNGLAPLRDIGANMTALAIDPSDSNRLYAAASGGGVFRSSDGGANWSALNQGLANLDVHSLAIAPGGRHVVYVGTSGGVFRITDDTP